jgi:predicted TIM-barrel fold metal-dependent hydrolase
MNPMPDTPAATITGIDAHAHVFTHTLDLAAERRYAPGYDATLAQYLGTLHAHGLSHGVLVQPSFLGTDNSYLLSALRQAPDRLRGVVVLAPDVSPAVLNDLAGQGVVGVRLNLMGKALPDVRDPAWKGFFGRIADLGWHVELHRQVEDLPGLVSQLLPFGARLVIDHFGRPEARLGVHQPGFSRLLELGLNEQVWLKVSGIYRLGGADAQALGFARDALPLLEQSFGEQRLVWGSDWPHTQHEQDMDFPTAVVQLHALGCSTQRLQALLVDAPRVLFGF